MRTPIAPWHVSRLTPSCGLALSLALSLSLTACGISPRTPPGTASGNATATTELNATTVTMPERLPLDAEGVSQRLNLLINDTSPDNATYAARKSDLLDIAKSDPTLPRDLRDLLEELRDFNAPRLGDLWQEYQRVQNDAADEYAKAKPSRNSALDGARIIRRLGPALYLVTQANGDTAFLSSSRRYKAGAHLRGLQVEEQSDQEKAPGAGFAESELADAPKTYVELTRDQLKRLSRERSPSMERLDSLEHERLRLEGLTQSELARLDGFTADAGEVLGPRLLGHVERPAPAAIIRSVKRLSKTWSRQQYYRYALPITGRKGVDAALRAHLETCRKDVQDLLHNTGVGRGRIRANMDLITFKAFTAAPGLLSIRFERYRDTGGAHGNTTFTSFVFDLRNQKVLSLGNIFNNVPAALPVLSDLAQRRMQQTMGGAPFPEGYAPNAENFSVFVLDGDDIVFTFAPYQVASYAQGTQTLRVPLYHPRLRALLSPSFLALRGGN